MNILEVLIRLRDDLKLWVTNNLLALKDEIDTKSTFSGSYEDLTDVPDFETQIEEIEEHVWDNDIHVTASDKTKWDNKSDFSGNYHDLEDAPDITDDGVGDLKFVDEDGNIIFKIDDEGIHTTNIEAMESITAETIILNGSDLEETIDNKLDVQTELLNEQIEDAVNEMDERLIEFGIVVDEHIEDSVVHVTQEDKVKWNNKSDFSGNYHDLEDAPDIEEDEAGDLKFVDEDGNIILKIDDEGLHTTNIEAIDNITANSITLNGSDLESTIDNKLDVQAESFNEQIEEVMNEMDERLIEFGIVVDDHIKDSVAHVTQEDKTRWNNKSDFSGNYHDLEDAPNIKEDDAGDLKFVDEDGNIIFKIDDKGIHTTNVEAVNDISAENLNVTNIVLDDDNILDIMDDKINKEIIVVNEQIENLISDTDANIAALDSKIDGVDSNLSSHKNDTVSHVTQDDKDNWNEHVLDDVLHVTAADKETWDEHVGNSVIHVTANDKTKWNNKSDFSGNYHDLEDAPEIEEDNAGDLKFVDEDGNIILQINDEGLHTTNIEAVNNISAENLDVASIILDNEDILDIIDNKIDKEIMIVDQQIEDLISSTDTKAAELDSKIDEHAGDNIVHVTQEDKTKWNNKSNFSGNYHDLEDAPEIEEDNAGDLKFVDDDGNIILTIDDEGLHTTNIEVSNNISADNLDVDSIALNSVDIVDVIDERIENKIAENKASIETVVQVDITDGFLVLTEDKYQKAEMVNGAEIILPTVTNFTEIHLYFNSYGQDMEIVFPDYCKWRTDFNIEPGYSYEIIAVYNTMNWLINVVAYS